MYRWASAFLLLVVGLSVSNAHANYVAELFVLPEAVALLIVAGVIGAAAYLVFASRWPRVAATTALTFALLAVMDSTSIALPLWNYYVDETVKMATYAAAIGVILCAFALLAVQARDRKLSALETGVLVATVMTGILWLGLYVIGRSDPSIGVRGMLIGEPLVSAVFYVFPAFAVSALSVSGMWRVASRLTGVSSGSAPEG